MAGLFCGAAEMDDMLLLFGISGPFDGNVIHPQIPLMSDIRSSLNELRNSQNGKLECRDA